MNNQQSQHPENTSEALGLTDEQEREIITQGALTYVSQVADVIYAQIEDFEFFDQELQSIKIVLPFEEYLKEKNPDGVWSSVSIQKDWQRDKDKFDIEQALVDKLLFAERYIECKTKKQQEAFRKKHCSIHTILHPKNVYVELNELLFWVGIYNQLFEIT